MKTFDRQRDADASALGRLAAFAARFTEGEPRPLRGPFTRWPRTSDAVLAVIVMVVATVSVAVSELDDDAAFGLDSIGDLPPGALGLLAIAAAALWWRRSRPVAVTSFVLAVELVWAVAGYGDGHEVVLVIALYSLGRHGSNQRQGLVWVATACAINIVGSVIDSTQRVDVLPAVVFTILPWYVGHRIRTRGDYLGLLQERARRLEAEQHARAREAVAAERSRIARELHDVVAHQVSMMTVQAGAARTIARDDLDASIEAMGDVERAGRTALGELRHLLGVLRRDADDPDDLGPQPRLRDITVLVDELVHTGADVDLTFTELPDRISTAVDLSAYRIVQESFTNIVKHAGPAPTVEVRVTLDDDAVVIDVVNTVGATTASPELPASGYGIAGMQERAVLLGGTLTARRQPPDRFCVHARIPLEPEPA